MLFAVVKMNFFFFVFCIYRMPCGSRRGRGYGTGVHFCVCTRRYSSLACLYWLEVKFGVHKIFVTCKTWITFSSLLFFSNSPRRHHDLWRSTHFSNIFFFFTNKQSPIFFTNSSFCRTFTSHMGMNARHNPSESWISTEFESAALRTRTARGCRCAAPRWGVNRRHVCMHVCEQILLLWRLARIFPTFLCLCICWFFFYIYLLFAFFWSATPRAINRRSSWSCGIPIWLWLMPTTSCYYIGFFRVQCSRRVYIACKMKILARDLSYGLLCELACCREIESQKKASYFAVWIFKFSRNSLARCLGELLKWNLKILKAIFFYVAVEDS